MVGHRFINTQVVTVKCGVVGTIIFLKGVLGALVVAGDRDQIKISQLPVQSEVVEIVLQRSALIGLSQRNSIGYGQGRSLAEGV